MRWYKKKEHIDSELKRMQKDRKQVRPVRLEMIAKEFCPLASGCNNQKNIQCTSDYQNCEKYMMHEIKKAYNLKFEPK